MELREWLPLVVSGVLGLAGIVAGLWGTLANLRAQDRRDKRAAVEREKQAERDAEAARRSHMLDERRTVYAEFLGALFDWMAATRLRLGLNAPGDTPDPNDATARRAREAGVIVQLIAPREVAVKAKGALISASEADVFSRDYAEKGKDHADIWDAYHQATVGISTLMKEMNADLAPGRSEGAAEDELDAEELGHSDFSPQGIWESR